MVKVSPPTRTLNLVLPRDVHVLVTRSDLHPMMVLSRFSDHER